MIGAGAIAAIGEGVVNLWRAVKGDRQQQDQQQAGFRGQVAANYAAEFAQRINRTLWDSLVDGLNRLPRPVIVALIIGYFVTAWRDPATFAAINAGLATVPEPMWWLLSSVVAFYFAARELSHKRKAGEFQVAAQAARELAQLEHKSQPSSPPPAEPTRQPNPSIAAWRAEQKQEQPQPITGNPFLDQETG